MAEGRWLTKRSHSNVDQYLVPQLGSLADEDARWLGEQVMLQLTERQLREVRRRYVGQSIIQITIETGQQTAELLGGLIELDEDPARPQRLREELHEVLGDIARIGTEHLQLLQTSTLNAMQDINQRRIQLERPAATPPTFIDVLPKEPEKRVGLFKKIGRFLFGDPD